MDGCGRIAASKIPQVVWYILTAKSIYTAHGGLQRYRVG